jgi:arylsulfatase A-like enzyme
VHGLLVLVISLFAMPTGAKAVAEQPNVVVILIDDLGWMDLGCQGNERVDTPHVDRLASQGMRFTDAYAAAPVCSPTRAAILTGRAPARLHLTTHIPDRFVPNDGRPLPAETLDHLPLQYVTISERLRAAGYRTAFMGKWHLAGKAGRQGLGKTEFYPERQGFELNLGGCALGGPPTYFDPFRIHNLEDRRPGEYLPDRLADEAIEFIRKNRNNPFLLFLWNYTVHWPMEAKPALVEKYARRKGPGLKDPRYGAKIEALDAAIGRIVAAIDKLDLTERTLLVFTSDNGGFSGVADNRPLRAGKGYLYEGGIRVPLVVRWPGVVPARTTCRVPVVSTDFYPTLLEVAGLSPETSDPSDGESLMPVLKKTGSLKRSALHFHFPNYAWHMDNRLGSAIRKGDYKLIERFDDGSVELYNLAEDIAESRELSAEMPEKAAELRRELHAWRTDCDARMPRRAPHGPE